MELIHAIRAIQTDPPPPVKKRLIEVNVSHAYSVVVNRRKSRPITTNHTCLGGFRGVIVVRADDSWVDAADAADADLQAFGFRKLEIVDKNRKYALASNPTVSNGIIKSVFWRPQCPQRPQRP